MRGLLLSLFLLLAISEVINLQLSDFPLLREKEWVLVFFSPSCPICNQIEPNVNEFSERMGKADFSVAKVLY
jgi:hypothetical protein